MDPTDPALDWPISEANAPRRYVSLVSRNGTPCGSSGDVAADGLNGDFMVFLMGFHSDFIGFNGDWMEIEYKVVPPFDS